jgi:ribonuclease T1
VHLLELAPLSRLSVETLGAQKAPATGLKNRLQAMGAPLVCALVLGGLFGVLGGTPAQARKSDPSGEPVITLVGLPVEGQKTYQLILAGGPFPYDKDGTVFGNRERILPSKSRGYYREYTVKTPGARNRGARRIICGGAKPQVPDLCYYTADHYESFSRIVP